MKRFEKFFPALLLLIATGGVIAQDFSVAPPLPAFPQFYETTEYPIRVDLVADGLSNPWAMAFLPNGDMLVTERAGRLRRIHDGALDPNAIEGVPDVKITVLGGLLGILLHPDFASNQILYLSYAKGHEDGRRSSTAIARAVLRQPALLILDEATSSLDHAAETAVQVALDALLESRRGECMTVVIAHRPKTLAGADVIGFLGESGTLEEFGTHDELLAIPGGRYRAVAQDRGPSAPRPVDAGAGGGPL